jgi:hypothetical protein
MSAVTVTEGRFEVEAALLAEAFGLDPATVRERMTAGEITSRFETGSGADEGRFRLSFRHAGRVLRLTVDGTGQILARSSFAAPSAGAGPDRARAAGRDRRSGDGSRPGEE